MRDILHWAHSARLIREHCARYLILGHGGDPWVLNLHTYADCAERADIVGATEVVSAIRQVVEFLRHSWLLLVREQWFEYAVFLLLTHPIYRVHLFWQPILIWWTAVKMNFGRLLHLDVVPLRVLLPIYLLFRRDSQSIAHHIKEWYLVHHIGAAVITVLFVWGGVHIRVNVQLLVLDSRFNWRRRAHLHKFLMLFIHCGVWKLVLKRVHLDVARDVPPRVFKGVVFGEPRSRGVLSHEIRVLLGQYLLLRLVGEASAHFHLNLLTLLPWL